MQTVFRTVRTGRVGPNSFTGRAEQTLPTALKFEVCEITHKYMYRSGDGGVKRMA